MSSREVPTRCWLLLVHQLPSEPSRLRVKIWRRLQNVGAVAIKGSVYVLPSSEESREDFEWIRAEIVASGGEALVFAADAVGELATAEVVEALRGAREADWQQLAERALAAAAEPEESAAEGAEIAGRERELRALRQRAAQIDRIDFFRAAGRQAALEAIEAIAARDRLGAGRERAATPAADAPPLDRAAHRARRWLTRPRPGVDRMASAWLIRRFVDSEAQFLFDDRLPADGSDVVPFDMYGVELGHQGAHCTFETIAARFGLDDPALAPIARIVHVLDLRGDVADDAEAAIVGRLVEGMRESARDDAALLEQGMQAFEALYQSFRRDGAVEPGGSARRPGGRSRSR
jgi:hypothetical protein